MGSPSLEAGNSSVPLAVVFVGIELHSRVDVDIDVVDVALALGGVLLETFPL